MAEHDVLEQVSNGDQLNEGFFNDMETTLQNTSSGHLHNGVDSRIVDKSSYLYICPIAYSSVIQGTWAIRIDNTAYANAFMSNDSADADGDEINFKIDLQRGTYTLFIIGRKDSSCGILDVHYAGTEIASFDWYEGVAADYANVKSQASISITSDGLQTLRLVVDGKNGSSSAYAIEISAIVFVRTA